MEVIIEMYGLDLDDAFKTLLDDKTELINIGEMIQEAAYYQAFNLSEQFCLEIKGTNKYISGRSTIIKQCLNYNKIDANILVFHKGLDGQIKMNKGEIIDLNFHKLPQIVNQDIHIQPQIQNQSQPLVENIMKTKRNDQQAGGVLIGGNNITESQHLRKIEEQFNQQDQSENILQHESLIQSNIGNQKKQYNLKIWLDHQQFQKYQELFNQDNIIFQVD